MQNLLRLALIFHTDYVSNPKELPLSCQVLESIGARPPEDVIMRNLVLSGEIEDPLQALYVVCLQLSYLTPV